MESPRNPGSGRSRVAQPIILGALGLTALTLGLQYVQYVREDRLLKTGLELEHSTEFEAPISTISGGSGLVGTSKGIEQRTIMDAKLTKMERALAWLENKPKGPVDISSLPEILIDKTAQHSPAMSVKSAEDVSAGETAAHHHKVDTKSSSKLSHRLSVAKGKEKKEEKKDQKRKEAEAVAVGGDEPFLLKRVLEALTVEDVTDYPRWYFGDMGARGYFEHGPWATTADVNLTNENFCGKARGKEGPWRTLAGPNALQPSQGRTSLVATVSRCAICDFLQTWDSYGKPTAPGKGLAPGGVVLIGGGNENWGFFSEHVENRSVAWGSLKNKVKGCGGKGPKDLRDFLDDPRIKLWVTNQHQAKIAVHPKILSLPLGMKNNPTRIYNDGMKKYRHTKKKKLLIINNSGWKHREGVNALVAAKFKDLGLKGNAYSVGKGSVKPEKEYYEQLAEAKFVLCPSGMGYDTYRHWEVLLMGSIPVFESSAGFDRTFAKLPALIVQSYDDVTPELLEATYADFAARADELFDFNRLKKGYWMDLVFSTAEAGSAARVIANHPPDEGIARADMRRRLLAGNLALN